MIQAKWNTVVSDPNCCACVEGDTQTQLGGLWAEYQVTELSNVSAVS